MNPQVWKIRLTAFFLAGMVLGPGVPHTAFGSDIQIDSPFFEYNEATKTYIYKDARIRVRTLVIDAETVEVQTEQAQILAYGRLRFQENSITGTARRMVFDTTKGTGIIYEAQIYDTETGYYLKADQILRSEENRYQAIGCSLTNCPPDQGGWRLESGEIDYRPDQFAVSTNTVLKVGGVPVLWLPIMAWPTVMKRQSGFLMPRLSFQYSTLERLNVGTRIKLPFFWALGKDHDLTITPETLERRGNALELEYAYAFWQDQKGNIRVWGIEEKYPRKPEYENDILPPGESARQDPTPKRGIAGWNHNQGFGKYARLVGFVNRNSDGQVSREYDKSSEYRPRQDYQATYTHVYSWGGAALTAQHSDEFLYESLYANTDANSNGHLIPQIKPSFSYAFGTRLWNTFLGVSLEGTATRFDTRQGLSAEAQMVRPALSLPIPLGGSAELRPMVSQKLVRYSALQITDPAVPLPETQNPEFTQKETQVEFRMPFAAEYAGNNNWEATKHRIIPRIILNEIQDIPQPYTAILYRAVPAARLLTFRLDNIWLGKSGDVASELASLNLIQRYNTLLEDRTYTPKGPPLPAPLETEPAGPNPMLPGELEASIYGKYLVSSIYLRYHHQVGRVTGSTISLRGNESANGFLQIGYTQNEFSYRTPLDDTLHPQGSGISFSGSMSATDNLGIGFESTINLQNAVPPLNRRLNHGLFFLDYHPVCYAVRLSYSEDIGVTQELGNNVYFVDRQVSLSFNLGGLVGSSKEIFLPSEQKK
ncbi:MAG: hypothetical protein OEW12_02110 [Deltaproteobacteria bacterium]|nr:hypothetical protein [Deltaproteobacteria bacterium]